MVALCFLPPLFHYQEEAMVLSVLAHLCCYQGVWQQVDATLLRHSRG